ncbi:MULTISPECIES: SusC/RagA family TonB-linked outer membrane protein [unclassified Pedobacter]|uniref:SusC/RagA family TonB-linked outer membrane protein n=1 Tax=unclassified Pedobacter TaxID=2628915 RepID=UPI00141DF10C|nr:MULTISPECIES: SusC/RagA family TonB-linked outer membrane protein [unclassified Pedobacter]NII84537.1 TonB-linked SusC/RagA family outer membrane protein [Pedobacter sp. SG908]NMN38549.1 TonB-linked SusC/RagA family outer membrane protein [Pedobacter sp. SG918]
MKKKLLFLFLGVCFWVGQVFAQQVTISGKVTSADDGTPLPGVSVKVKGSTAGISTDSDGRYTIKATSDQVLVFVYIGSITEERHIGDNRVINVQLKQDAKTLNEVAITAFGVKQEVRSLGFSTQNVKAKEIVDSQQPNLVNAMQGKVAGVQITNSSGAPGSSANIMIRGGSSLSGNNQPLFVVDGIPVDNTTPVSQAGLAASTAPASNRAIDINPEDIESLTVLKGPAAAALYGIRAASGAIVITTKKGSGGAAKITYQNTFSLDNVNQLPELQGKYKQGEAGNFSATAPNSWGPEFAANETVYDNLKNFFKTAFSQSHDLSVSGSSEKSTFYTSASLLDQGSIVDNSDFRRKSFRINADTKIGEKLTVGGSANYVRTDRTSVPQGSANGTMGALYWPRNDDMTNYLNPNGSQRVFPGGNDNPYWTIQNKPITSGINRFIGIANINYNPFSFLNLTYRLGTDLYTENFKAVRMPGTLEADALKGAIGQNTNTNQITTSTFIATAKKTFWDDYNFSLAIGNNIENTRVQTLTANAINFIDPTFPSINNTVATDRSVSETLNRRRIVGVFGDFNFDWKNIIYVNLRARNDWTSTIPVGDNAFFYPAISTSVVLTDLLKELKLKSDDQIFSYGKIRAAYSNVGKDAPPHVTTTSLAAVTNTFTINPRGFITNANNPFGNPMLVPEFTRAFEVGADLRFVKNRFGIDFTYYRSKSDNQILATRVPPSAGAFLTYLNGGAIQNKGIEVVLNAQAIVKKDFKWTIDINFAHNKSIVKELPGALDRVELSDAWVAANVAQGAGFLNGSLFGINGNVWKRNAQGQLLLGNNGYPQVQVAYANIGDRNPDFTSGITNTFNYKNFALSFMVDIRVGGDVFNATENSLVRSGLSTKTLDRGSKVFDGIIESTGLPSTLSVPLNQNYYQTIYASQGYDFVEDGSWYRLRYATLTYNMPSSFLAKTKLKGLAFTVTGRNLILITKYSGVDPEVSGSGAGVGGSGSFGFDNLGIPATRGIDMGLRLTF